MAFQIKRIYDPVEKTDGARVLVDRLWPRGVSKQRAELTEWLKDISPSPELRKWFGHQAGRLEEFARKYRAELDHDSEKQQAARELLEMSEKGMVTLLYGAKDPQVNHALVLMEWLNKKQ